jgi:hypothetical protein
LRYFSFRQTNFIENQGALPMNPLAENPMDTKKSQKAAGMSMDKPRESAFKRQIVRLRCPTCGGITEMPSQICCECGTDFKYALPPKKKISFMIKILNFIGLCAALAIMA